MSLFTIRSSSPSTRYPYLENILLLDQKKFSIIQKKKTLKKFFTRLLFVKSNRYKFQIKDKKSLLILKVQNIVFNVGKICVFWDFFEYPESGLSRFKFQQYSAIIFMSHLPWYLFSVVFISWWNCSPCSLPISRIFSGDWSRWLWRKCTLIFILIPRILKSSSMFFLFLCSCHPYNLCKW